MSFARLVCTAPSSSSLVSLAEAKAHVGAIGFTDDDSQLTAMAAAAQAMLDGPRGLTGRALFTSTWRLSCDGWPCGGIRIPLGPVSSISSVTYTDLNGSTQTLASSLYTYDLDADPVLIVPSYSSVWPPTRDTPGAVKVTFVAGETTPPADLKAACLLLIGHLYANREAASADSLAEIPMAVSSIVNRYAAGRVA